MAEEKQKNENAPEQNESAIEANAVELEELSDEKPESKLSLNLLMDISLPVSVELGRTTLEVSKLLELGPGSVVELDKMAGEPADLYVRGVKFASGEVVVIENNFGLRITEVADRKKNVDGLDQ